MKPICLSDYLETRRHETFWQIMWCLTTSSDLIWLRNIYLFSKWHLPQLAGLISHQTMACCRDSFRSLHDIGTFVENFPPMFIPHCLMNVSNTINKGKSLINFSFLFLKQNREPEGYFVYKMSSSCHAWSKGWINCLITTLSEAIGSLSCTRNSLSGSMLIRQLT